MAQKVKVLILRTAGTNCDKETAFAFSRSGASADLLHIQKLLENKKRLHDYHILAIPGGFTYGDDIESGRILANEVRLKLGEELKRFTDEGKLAIGICNGFQVMVKAGMLPGSLDQKIKGLDFKQTVTLVHNDSGKFEDRWINLKVRGKSVWTAGLKEMLYLPVAHGEGKFIVGRNDILDQLKNNDQIVFQYTALKGEKVSYPDNPNGSVEDIAGITDISGRILGLMPHPERHFLSTQHPYWKRLNKKDKFGDGAKIFENGINYAKKNL